MTKGNHSSASNEKKPSRICKAIKNRTTEIRISISFSITRTYTRKMFLITCGFFDDTDFNDITSVFTKCLSAIEVMSFNNNIKYLTSLIFNASWRCQP